MKRSTLWGVSVLAVGGVAGGGVLLSGALNSSGAGDKSLEQPEIDQQQVSPLQGPDVLAQPTPPPKPPTIVFHMNPELPSPTVDIPVAEESPEDEDDEPEQTVAPLTVEHTQEPEDTHDQELSREEIVDYTITDPALVLVESCVKSLTHEKLRQMINFLAWENASFEDHIVNLQQAQRQLQNLLATLSSYSRQFYNKPDSYTCETLNTNYKKWLGLWDKKITSAGDDSGQWKSMRDQYISRILKKDFWQAFLKDYTEYQAKLPEIEKSFTQS